MKPSFCHLFRHFSVTMEHHCALKVAKHLFKNKGHYHHNANDRFGLKQQSPACGECRQGIEDSLDLLRLLGSLRTLVRFTVFSS